MIVDKAAHKAIVIGRGGEKLKRVASEARVEMEKLFDGKVFLETWVKVRSGWPTTNARSRAWGTSEPEAACHAAGRLGTA